MQLYNKTRELAKVQQYKLYALCFLSFSLIVLLSIVVYFVGDRL